MGTGSNGEKKIQADTHLHQKAMVFHLCKEICIVNKFTFYNKEHLYINTL